MKLTRWLVVLLVLIGSTSSFAAQTWTILVYGHADHNLSYSLMRDMLEMEQVGSSEGFNIVVQADYDGEKNPNYKGSFRYLIQKGDPKLETLVLGGKEYDEVPVPSSTPIEKSEELDLDKTENFKAFLKWGINKYPAQRYGLVLWDHGGQWKGGFGGDTQDGTTHGPGMKIAEIGKIINEVRNELTLGKFDFITFDTCLLGGMELLPDMVKHTDTYIANAEIDYGAGWDYNGALGWLKNNPDATMRNFSIEEVKTYQAHHNKGEADKMLKAHAAFDLTKYPHYQNSALSFFDAVASAVTTGGASELLLIQKARSETTKYDISSPAKAKDDTNYIDIGEFAVRLKNETANTNVKQSADQLTAAINDMIIAKDLGTLRQSNGAFGLSIYYPQKGLDVNYTNYQQYNLLAFITETVNGLANKWSEILVAVGIAQKTDNSPTIKPNANQEINITDNNLAALRISVLHKTFGLSKQAVFADNKVTLPLVEVTDNNGETKYFKVILTSNAQGSFNVEISGVADFISGLTIPSTFDSNKLTLSIPIVVFNGVSYQAELKYQPESNTVTLLDAQPAQLITYLNEVSYTKITSSGNYPVQWNGEFPVLKGANGTNLLISGFRAEPNSNILIGTALYLGPDTDDIKLVMLQIDTSTNKVIQILDGETPEGIAPKGIEVKEKGLLLPLYYAEIRTNKPADQWLLTTLIGDVDPLVIPKEGLSGLSLINVKVAGSFVLEAIAEDTFGNTSTPKLFEVSQP